jgi:N-methyl-L-proline demethylase
LAARNPRRRDLAGIVDWRLAELHRLGVEVQFDSFVDGAELARAGADVVVVATGGLAQLPSLSTGAELVHTSWEVLGGEVTLAGEVLFFDDNGSHSAMSAAELLARKGASVEVVTPERMLGIEVGGLNYVPYARAFNETGTRITLNQRLLSVSRAADGRLCAVIGSDHSPHTETRMVDAVVVDHGTEVNASPYFALKPLSTNGGAVDYGALMDGRPQDLVRNPAGTFQLFRIGDAVAGRNIHAAIYDALRLLKDV